MDIGSIRSTLNESLNLMDEMDRNQRGMQVITQGAHTTKDVFLKELGIFLLNVADEYFFINSEQAELLDMVMDKGFSFAPSDKIKQIASSIDKLDPENNMSIRAFTLSDAMLSYHTGSQVTDGTNSMIGLYKLMGMMFIVAGGYQNESAMNRIDRYTAGLERRIPAIKAEYAKIVAAAAEESGIKPAPTVPTR